MNDKVVIVTRNRVVGHAFAEFFRDLFAGDPVAIGIAIGMFLFVVAIAAAGMWFLWQRKQAKDAFQKKVADKRKKEDAQYKASRKPKDL